MLVFRWFIPRSIRWYLSANKYDEAEKLIDDLEKKAIARIKGKLPEIKPGSIFKKAQGFRHLLKRENLKIIVFFTAIWIFYYIGAFTWLTLNTKLFILAGFELRNSLFLVASSSIGFIIGAAMSIVFSDRFERKMILAIAALAWADHCVVC